MLRQLCEQRGGHPFDPGCLRLVDVELAHESCHRCGTYVEMPAGFADQFAEQAMAQAAIGGVHAVDAQQIEDRAQDADTTGNDVAPVFLHAGQA